MKYCNTHYGMYDEAQGCPYCPSLQVLKTTAQPDVLTFETSSGNMGCVSSHSDVDHKDDLWLSSGGTATRLPSAKKHFGKLFVATINHSVSEFTFHAQTNACEFYMSRCGTFNDWLKVPSRLQVTLRAGFNTIKSKGPIKLQFYAWEYVSSDYI